ncbi:MAG: C1 family peptidase [Anaerolineae bacterium]
MNRSLTVLTLLVLLLNLVPTDPISTSSVRAEAPTLPTPTVEPTAETTPEATDTTPQSAPAPPSPEDIPKEVQEARAREAMEAVLNKYLDHLGARYRAMLREVAVDGAWAHGVAAWQSEATVTEGPLHLLARRDEQGTWQALLPSEEGLFPQWVEAVPENFVAMHIKKALHDQIIDVNNLFAARSSQTSELPSTTIASVQAQDEFAYDNMQSMRNPAAVYCAELGYTHEVVDAPDGSQQGICRLSDQLSCKAWDFLEGRCGQAYNACARQGLDTISKRDSASPFSPFSALCVDADGREIVSAAEAVSLAEKSVGASEPYSSTYPVAPSVPSPSLGTRNLSAPSFFDWRNYNGGDWLTPIKNQGICGSCWAFAAVGVAEAATNVGYRNPALDPDMSEQYLVTDCAVNAGDCAGGWGTSALSFIRDDGVPDEGCLPYHDGDPDGCTYNSNGCRDDMCTYCSDTECSDYQCSDRCSDWDARLYSVARADTTWYPARDTIKNILLAHGPLAVSIYMGGSFDGNGVYHCDPDPSYTNHGVSIVGYNDAGNYWIVRNSWGSNWNGDGYFKVAYGHCLIERYVTSVDLAACNDEHELNDTPDLATDLSYGQTLDADICYIGDEDFYAFSGATGDKVVVDIDAQSEGSSLDSYLYLLDSDGTTVLAQNDDEPTTLDAHLSHELPHDGTYYIKVRDYGYEGGTDYTYSIHLLTDAVTPTAEITSPPTDSWLDPETVTVTVSADDNESGVNRVEFLWHDADWENSDWVWLGADYDGRDGWRWPFDASAEDEQRGGAFYVWTFDWAGNWTGAASWNLGIDRTPPDSAYVNTYAPYGDAPFRDFHLYWGGWDALSGVANYDVQVRDSADGVWADLATAITETYTRYVGDDGHTYDFRARARDHAGNVGAYSDVDSYTVDICDVSADAFESDNAFGSATAFTPDGMSQIHNVHIEEDADWVKFTAQAGVTYTLTTANFGGHADTVLTLYDTDGSTQLAENDDCPDRWPSSCLDWQAPGDGTYYVKVTHWDEYAYGCTTEYGLSITSNRPASLELGEPGTAFRYVETLGETETAYPADTGYLNGPNGLFIDDGALYVAEELGARLLKYDTSDGANLLSLGTAGFQNRGTYTFDHPKDVAVDGGGNLWMVDRHRVAQYDPSGHFLQEFPPDDPWNAGDDDSHFNTPRGIAFDSEGRMYISDSENHRIQVYTFDVAGTPVYSTTIGVTGEPGDDNAHFNYPAQIFVNSGDFLYVTDVNNYRIQRCSYTDGWTCSTIHGTGSAGDGSDALDLAYGLAAGLGTGGSGDLYIADSANGRVKECSADMFGWTCHIFVEGLDWPAGVAVDTTGKVYVSSYHDHTIRTYDSDGNELSLFKGASDDPYVPDDSHYNTPYGVAVDETGNIFIVEEKGYRLIKLNAAGELQWAVGEPGMYGSDNAHFGDYWRGPTDVAVNSSGNVYVADTGNHRIQVFDSSGTYVKTLGSLGSGDNQFQDPYGIAVDGNGNIYVADEENHRVQIFNSGHTYQATLGVTDEPGGDNNRFDHPRGVAVDSEGRVYVADLDNARVQRCTVVGSSGACETFAGATGVIGDDFAHLRAPLDVAVDDQGRVYVLDGYWNQRVQVFDSDGAYLTTVGGQWGKRMGQFRNPEGMYVSADGMIYVADSLNHRIQTFSPGVSGWTPVNLNGFGDPKTTGVSALVEFNGALYAGASNWESNHAQLWRSDTGTSWEEVTPDALANHAVNDLIVFDGALYAGTGWGGGAGQLWRSTDGTNWSAVVSDGFGDSDNEAVAKLAVFNGKLYAGTHNTSDGFGIWRSATGDPGSWEPVLTDGHGSAHPYIVTGLTVFNDQLYAACENKVEGAEIWRSTDGSTWEQVVSGGFGDSDNTQTGGFAVFDDDLYIGTRNNTTSGQLWRSADGSEWAPISQDGFGDESNGKIESLHVAYNALYAITYNSDTGAQVWRSDDGATWDVVREDGWGDANNYASLWNNAGIMFNGQFYVGTWNDANGGELWRMDLQAVRADFTAAPISADAPPLTVDFTNLSTGDYTESAWDFGDGGTSTDEHPTHTYEEPGTYTVRLTVTGPGGEDVATRSDYITVDERHYVYLPLILR